LEPCASKEAARIYDESRLFDHREGLNESQFDNVRTQSADLSAAEGCDWLRSQSPQLTEKIIVSWDRETALRTDWDLFTSQWDDFCYPATDDLLVLPASAEWILRYHHEEIFYFGVRKCGERQTKQIGTAQNSSETRNGI
jgi:hypothetical protein